MTATNDEAYAAWEACACDRYEDEENGNPLDLPQGMPNFADFRDGYRAGEMAEALRALALVDFAVAMEEHDDNEVCDAASDALDTYWGRP